MDILVGEEVGSTKKYANKDVDIRSVHSRKISWNRFYTRFYYLL